MPNELTVEFTEHGYLYLDADIAREYFPNDVLVILVRGAEAWLMPMRGAAGGGLMLKQRNLQGDRGVLIWESLPEDTPAGIRPAFWDKKIGALRVALEVTG